MDNARVTALVLLDLTSAFDRVEHRLLSVALREAGISGYLEGRTQSVVIDGCASDPAFLKTGVPQGSVLGPLLFCIFMIGLGDVIRRHNLTFVVFADDVQIFGSFKASEAVDMSRRFQLCVDDLADGFVSKRLLLNGSKSELILFGSPQQLKKVSSFRVVLGGEALPIRSSVRDLGFMMDSNRQFNVQVSAVCRAAFCHLRMLHRVAKLLDVKRCLLLVHSLVISRVNFCCSLCVGLSKSLEKKLDQVIRSAFRVAVGCGRRDDISAVLRHHEVLLVH